MKLLSGQKEALSPISIEITPHGGSSSVSMGGGAGGGSSSSYSTSYKTYSTSNRSSLSPAFHSPSTRTFSPRGVVIGKPCLQVPFPSYSLSPAST